MKRAIILGCLVLFTLTAFGTAMEAKKYGNGVSLSEATPVGEILANPEAYMGKKVRVDGIITGVCKKRGCWIQISDENGKGIRIKVEDGVIVFPATSMGHKASAEGVFTGIPISALEKKHQEHEGEKHEACDSKPEGAMVYFIKGTGAEIES